MSQINEVLAFTRAYVNNPSERTPERNNQIRAAYRQITGEPLTTTCGTCLIEALLKIKAIMETKQQSRYQLKPGALRQPVFGDSSTWFTNANITDELAEMDLRLNPGAKKFYSRIPEPEIMPATKITGKEEVKTDKKIIPAIKSDDVKSPDVKADQNKTDNVKKDVFEQSYSHSTKKWTLYKNGEIVPSDGKKQKDIPVVKK